MAFADPSNAASSESRIAALADQCVQCGLCLPHCPTYRVSGNEAESPRGRIALARALASGSLVDTDSASRHLDHCLSCMSCETVCPSQVQYGALLQEVRELHPASSPFLRRLQPWLAKPRRLRALAAMLRVATAWRWMPRVLRRWMPDSPLTHAARELPAIPAAIALPALTQSRRETSRGRVGLMLGCVASVFDRDTHAASIRLLAALGYDVVIAPDQGCCGALARHAGHVDEAQAAAASTRRAIVASHVDSVLISASGCFDTVRDFTLADSGIAVHDALSFIAADRELASLRFRPLPKKAALHIACTQSRIAGSVASMRRLLAAIPELQVLAMEEQPTCCGASGSYFLDFPDISQPLRAAKLAQIDTLSPDLVLSANIGCRLYLGNGLRQGASRLDLIHPLTLLAQQLESA